MTSIQLLPVSGEPPGRREATERAEDSSPADGVKVLVVEDEFVVSCEIEDTLASAAFNVTAVVGSAEEAIAAAAAERPDFVLMDIRLRGSRDGVDAAIEVYRRFGLRCIFISAHLDAYTRERAQAAEPIGWLAKPFSSYQLLQAIRNARQAGPQS